MSMLVSSIGISKGVEDYAFTYGPDMSVDLKFGHVSVICLHSRIDRDFEVKHVGVANDGRTCIIDLGTCVPLSPPRDSAEPSGYSGEGSWAFISSG